MTARARRRLAQVISTRTLDPPITAHQGVVVSVQSGSCTVTIDAGTVNVPGVPFAVGLSLAAGQVVDIEFVGRAPKIIRRVT